MPTTARTAVVAVGGNALLDGGGPATIAEQFAAARRLAPQLCRLVADGWRIVLTHGNGPQVGFIMRRSDLVADIEPGLPQLDLDMAVADSQGSLGYILGATLEGELRAAGLRQQVVAMLTHTVVDGSDPAFGAPTKPIGGFYEEAVARRLAEANGWAVAEDSGRGWRRLRASPRPGRRRAPPRRAAAAGGGPGGGGARDARRCRLPRRRRGGWRAPGGRAAGR